MSEREISLLRAEDVSYPDWVQMHEVARVAYGAALEETGFSEITDAVVSWKDDVDHTDFIRSHVTPQSEVGGRLNFNQILTTPTVAIARVDGQIVSYGFSTHGSSGGGSPKGPQNDSLRAKAVRRGKLMSVNRNYLNIVDIATHPDYQQQHLAKQVGKALLLVAFKHQPTTGDGDPQKLPKAVQLMQALGFEPTTTVPDEKSHGLSLVRYQGPTVGTLLSRL